MRDEKVVLRSYGVLIPLISTKCAFQEACWKKKSMKEKSTISFGNTRKWRMNMRLTAAKAVKFRLRHQRKLKSSYQLHKWLALPFVLMPCLLLPWRLSFNQVAFTTLFKIFLSVIVFSFLMFEKQEMREWFLFESLPDLQALSSRNCKRFWLLSRHHCNVPYCKESASHRSNHQYVDVLGNSAAHICAICIPVCKYQFLKTSSRQRDSNYMHLINCRFLYFGWRFICMWVTDYLQAYWLHG